MRVNARRSSSSRSFSCNATSGSSAGSAMVASIFSSSSASVRRRHAASALWRGKLLNHFQTGDRHFKRPPRPHTSKSGQREPFGGRNMLFPLLFFPESQGREPDSCFVHL